MQRNDTICKCNKTCDCECSKTSNTHHAKIHQKKKKITTRNETFSNNYLMLVRIRSIHGNEDVKTSCMFKNISKTQKESTKMKMHQHL